MSPVSTATRASWGRASRVRSRSVVLPDPGELIRFTQKTSWWRKRSRSEAAMRSFSLRTFSSNGSRFIFFFNLHESQLQLVSADALRRNFLALGTAEVIRAHDEGAITVVATMTART